MGLIHLDAGVIIGFLDGNDSHHVAASAALSDALGRNDRLFMAASALAECLVSPARKGQEQIDLVGQMIDRLPIRVVSLDAEIAAQAAVLRATHRSLRLPDALVIGTAACAGADRLVTTDHNWPTAKKMKLSIEIERI